MNKNRALHQYQEGLFSAISVGFCLLLIGFLFAINPNLFDYILAFFKNFKLVDVPHTNIVLPAPEFPFLYVPVYQAAEQFSIAVTVLQVIILSLRFVIPSSLRKKAETVGGVVYWGGTSFLIQSFLIDKASVSLTYWFEFWSLIIVLAGVSFLARAAVMAVSRI